MPNIYERPFPKSPNAPVRQFTSCCGGSDKGCDGGVACRSCYRYIDGYYGVGEEEEFIATIEDPRMVEKFKAMLAEKYDTYDEWHVALMGKIRTKKAPARKSGPDVSTGVLTERPRPGRGRTT